MQDVKPIKGSSVVEIPDLEAIRNRNNAHNRPWGTIAQDTIDAMLDYTEALVAALREAEPWLVELAQIAGADDYVVALEWSERIDALLPKVPDAT